MKEKPKSSGKIYYGETRGEASQTRGLQRLSGTGWLKKQLPGFDEEYRDIVDYVLKITPQNMGRKKELGSFMTRTITM